MLIGGKTSVVGIGQVSNYIFDKYLLAGVTIHEMYRQELHAKTIVVDGIYVALGTYNLDRISYKYNMEVMVIMKDLKVAAQLERLFVRNVPGCRPITRADFAVTPLIYQMIQFCFYHMFYKVWR